MLQDREDILRQGISGYHQYRLDSPIRLNFVSRSLCRMTGYREEDLLRQEEDLYARQAVHPADREGYVQWLQRLAEKEQTLTHEYRLGKKDGSVIWVRDTAVSRRLEDGSLVGDSVLTDITDLKNENRDLRFLNETIPCGFLKYTCEKQPRVTYLNQKMMDIFRFPKAREGELDYLELYKSNIFLMIPMEERRRFSLYLNRVYSAGAPIAGEMTLLRCDGTRVHLFGWVTKCVNEKGEEEFQSICMDVTERRRAQKTAETKRYLKALTDVYDKIFEFNIAANTVKCLHCGGSALFLPFENVAMQTDDAVERWAAASVAPEDRERFRTFFRDFCQKKLEEPGAKPPQISYRAKSSTGEFRRYSGIFLKVDEMVSFYCCRTVPDPEEAEVIRSENAQLKENMKELVRRFADGLAAFEVTAAGVVKPLYVSENICEFFGYTEEEWLGLMEEGAPVESFIAYSEAGHEDFAELLRNGEGEFDYFDYRTETRRRIKAICSQREPGGGVSRFVMLYSVEEAETKEKKSLPENCAVSIRTFGYFDVFVGERPIAFRNKKSKELFALLVDRKGGYVTSEEAISFLWEEEPVNTVTLARYRKAALRLKNTLEEYGIPEVIEAVDGKRRIVPERVRCDLYDYLSGREEFRPLFKGSYLTNYSWGETTLAELSGEILS